MKKTNKQTNKQTIKPQRKKVNRWRRCNEKQKHDIISGILYMMHDIPEKDTIFRKFSLKQVNVL